MRFEGTMHELYTACLWSRLANRILTPLASFPVEGPNALYDGVAGVDWADHLEPDGTIAVDGAGVITITVNWNEPDGTVGTVVIDSQS